MMAAAAALGHGALPCPFRRLCVRRHAQEECSGRRRRDGQAPHLRPPSTPLPASSSLPLTTAWMSCAAAGARASRCCGQGRPLARPPEGPRASYGLCHASSSPPPTPGASASSYHGHGEAGEGRGGSSPAREGMGGSPAREERGSPARERYHRGEERRGEESQRAHEERKKKGKRKRKLTCGPHMLVNGQTHGQIDRLFRCGPNLS